MNNIDRVINSFIELDFLSIFEEDFSKGIKKSVFNNNDKV